MLIFFQRLLSDWHKSVRCQKVFLLASMWGCSHGPVKSVTDNSRHKAQRQMSRMLKHPPSYSHSLPISSVFPLLTLTLIISHCRPLFIWPSLASNTLQKVAARVLFLLSPNSLMHNFLTVHGNYVDTKTPFTALAFTTAFYSKTGPWFSLIFQLQGNVHDTLR